MAKKTPTADMILQGTADTLAEIRKEPAPKATAEQDPHKRGRKKKYLDGVGRLCLSIPDETRRQLEQIAYDDSRPGQMVSVTQTIVKLAAEETKRREKAKARKAEQ